jgi:hypothetical protein
MEMDQSGENEVTMMMTVMIWMQEEHAALKRDNDPDD